MRVNEIYVSWNGEQNVFGLGTPAIFLRMQGCHIRCYKETLGVLCDTPHSLEKSGGREMTPEEIVMDLKELRYESGVRVVTLTGGEPLWRSAGDLHKLFALLSKNNFFVSVETSGTLDWTPYIGYEGVFFVVDYKTHSAGVKGNIVAKLADKLRHQDYVKFVIHDKQDLEEMLEFVQTVETPARICAGVYWGGKIDNFQLFSFLKEKRQLGRIVMNFQTHAMAADLLVDKSLLPASI